MFLKELYSNKWIRFSFWAILYLLWVIWLGNYWFLLGLIIIFDHHISRKVKWLFWKKSYKEGEKHNLILDWLDALIFAVIVVTFINTFFIQAFKIPSSSMESTLYTGDYLFVSKLAYGPRIPKTPLTIPFTNNTIFGRESYSTLIQNKYHRLWGFSSVKEGDCVVFNFPHGDSVLTKAPAEDYYNLCRIYGRDIVIQKLGPVIVRPYDKEDNYVKRCVAVAGDTLQVINGNVFINTRKQETWPGVQNAYNIKTINGPINDEILYGLRVQDPQAYFNSDSSTYYNIDLTQAMCDSIRKLPNVVYVKQIIDTYPPDPPDTYLSIFPYTKKYKWTIDNYGPIWVPKKGVRVHIDTSNIALYKRIISVYEGNKLSIKDGHIFINGKETDSYKFKQNYYFMMGDNRHNSLDSRYWGFVPEQNVVGKPVLVWLSINSNRSFPNNIRWRRFLKVL